MGIEWKKDHLRWMRKDGQWVRNPDYDGSPDPMVALCGICGHPTLQHVGRPGLGYVCEEHIQHGGTHELS